VDLDVLGRAELMSFLRSECVERPVTLVYATHIFDGLESFMSHVAFVANGELKFCKKFEDIEGLKDREPGSLLATVEGWLREEYVLQRERKALEKKEKKDKAATKDDAEFDFGAAKKKKKSKEVRKKRRTR